MGSAEVEVMTPHSLILTLDTQTIPLALQYSGWQTLKFLTFWSNETIAWKGR